MIKIFVMVMLGFFSYSDLKKRSIGRYSTWSIVALTLCVTVLEHGLVETLKGCLVGGILGIMSVILPGSIGMGDALLFIVCGSTLGLEGTLVLSVVSFMLAGIIGGLFVLQKGNSIKSEIPFIPFLFISYIGVYLYEKWL